MHDADPRTPTEPPQPATGRSARPRPDRSRWLVLLVAAGITAGVGVGAAHGGDRGFTGSICEALERAGSPGGAAAHCATATAAAHAR